jgi:hypothetical protein
MELIPTWEAISCSATQDILNILWNLKVYYGVSIWMEILNLKFDRPPNIT